MRKSLAVAVALAFAAFAAHAQQYRWIDEKGRVQYTDTPPPPSAKATRRIATGTPAPAVPATKPAAAEPADRLQERAPVSLYTHPGCADSCQLARNVLNRRGVAFKEIQVVALADIEALKNLSGSTNVPVLVVGDRVERTVTAAAFNAALDAAGYPKAGILPARAQAAPPAPKQEDIQTATGGEKPPAAPPAADPAPRGPYAPGAGAQKPPAKTQ